MKLGPVVQEEISLKEKVYAPTEDRHKTDHNTFDSGELKKVASFISFICQNQNINIFVRKMNKQMGPWAHWSLT